MNTASIIPCCPCGKTAVAQTTLALNDDCRWRCACPNCYDPTPRTEELGPDARCVCEGFGATLDEAIADWWEQAVEAWGVISLVPNTMLVEISEQAGDEADRQEGWMLVSCPAVGSWPAGNWWAPKPAGVSP